MYSQSLILELCLLAGAVGVVALSYKKILRVHRKISLQGTSVLLSYYTDGVTIIPAKRGMFGDLHYATFAGVSFGPKDAGEPSIVYEVILPFSSYLHLVGIPKAAGTTQLDPAGEGSIMEPVVLEGDYPDYFTLYAEKEMQTDSRYTLNPKAMIFTIEFCRNFSWEIVGNELYMVKSVHEMGTPIDIASVVQKFVAEIAPAISRPLTDEQLEKVTPYSDEYRTDLKCPVCHADFINEQDYLACRSGDGVLIKGTALTRLHAGALKIPATLLRNKGHQTVEAINCPGCQNPMEKVSYNGGKTIIDVCMVCPYRWLDAGDQVVSLQ